MGYDRKQLEAAIRKVLFTAPRPICTEAAVQLLLGTAAKESNFGHFLVQTVGVDDTKARGVFQVEPATAEWLEDALRQDLAAWARSYRDDEPIKWALEMRLDYQIAMCRLRYWIVPAPLPAAGDISGMARYWKQYYNTAEGKGTTAEFEAAYRKYVEQR